MPQLSVIIPCHDNERVLRWSLKSLSASGIPDVEVICVDDASTVDLGPLVQSYGAIYVRLPGGSSGRRAMARNDGHRIAKGRISLYLDGDMIPEPRLIGSAIRMHQLHSRVAVKYSVYNVPQSNQDSDLSRIGDLILGNRFAELGPSLRRTAALDTRPLPRRLRGQPTNLWTLCASHCFSIERRFVDQAGGWDEHFLGWGEEDLELAYRLHRIGVQFVFPRRKLGAAYHIDHHVDWARNLASLDRNARYFRDKFPSAWPARVVLLRAFLRENNFDDIPVIKDDPKLH